jgi:type I restriction enzyme R subunit
MPAITPEQKAREQIDKQLEQAGWVVQNPDEMHISAARGVAVREVPLAGGYGSADYLLFADRRAIGVIEAKKEGDTLTGVEVQSEKYSVGLPPNVPAWHQPIPFLYQSTGAITQFTNTLDPDPRSRNVFTFHRPETLLSWAIATPGIPTAANSAPPSLQRRLRGLPPLLTEGMRDAQVSAIRGIERSLAENRPRSLVQMTMGSGKSYTAVAESYRLLEHAGAKRILFLVDRGNLGKQAFGEFDQYVTPDDGRRFTELYTVQHVKSNSLDDVAKVSICTVQRLYSILKGAPEFDDEVDEHSASDLAKAFQNQSLPVVYNPFIPPEFFDFIIVDECHRSIYNLWRQVIEYFDAYIIGLTATPSKQTFGFFNQNLVMEYGHAQGVADGVNVDFDVYEITTKITKQGEKVEAGYWVDRRDRRSRRVRWQQLEADLTYTATDLDRSVVAEDQIRTVIRTFRDKLFVELFLGRTIVPKTLIFAKDDSHADDIVRIVREEFGKSNKFCEKITYRSSTVRIVDPGTGAITYRTTGVTPEHLLSSFRNSFDPRIVVTVDMIATGTDVRPLEIVFFMRDVKSANYFEQMKGRGSRVVSPEDLQAVSGEEAFAKTKFILVDAVGVCKREQTDSPSLERKPSVPLKDIFKQVAMGATDEATVSTLAGRLARLSKQLSPAQISSVEATAGQSLQSIVQGLAKAVDPDALELAAQEQFSLATDVEPTPAQLAQAALAAREAAVLPLLNPRVRQAIIDSQHDNDQIIDRVSQDEVIFAGISEAAKEKAQQKIGSFTEYLEKNRDEITAIQLLYSQPYGKGPTLKDLQQLAAELAAPPQHLTPDILWEAYRQVEAEKVYGNSRRDKVADLVSLVRFALKKDGELSPFEEAVRERFANWMAHQAAQGKTFTPNQHQWLEMMRDQVAASLTVEPDDLDTIPFTNLGGLGAAYDTFGDELYPLLSELNGVLVA